MFDIYWINLLTFSIVKACIWRSETLFCGPIRVIFFISSSSITRTSPNITLISSKIQQFTSLLQIILKIIWKLIKLVRYVVFIHLYCSLSIFMSTIMELMHSLTLSITDGISFLSPTHTKIFSSSQLVRVRKKSTCKITSYLTYLNI